MPVATTITADPAWVNAASPMLLPPTVHHSGRWRHRAPLPREPPPEPENTTTPAGQAAEREELRNRS